MLSPVKILKLDHSTALVGDRWYATVDWRTGKALVCDRTTHKVYVSWSEMTFDRVLAFLTEGQTPQDSARWCLRGNAQPLEIEQVEGMFRRLTLRPDAFVTV